MTKNQYLPDAVTPPGTTLAETLAELGMSQSELALRMGRPQKTLGEIIAGRSGITPDTALQLEHVLGIPARFWIIRELHYQEWRARQREAVRLRAEQDWLAALPVNEMTQRRWIEPAGDTVAQLRALLRFFGVASPAEWRQMWLERKGAFREAAATVADAGALSAWLRKGQLEAQKIKCADYNGQEFMRSLQLVRALTVKPAHQFLADARQLCAAAGVAFVVLPAPANCHAGGAMQWLTHAKAMLLLSVCHTTDDQFWFSFFHAAGHIVLHGKREVFVDASARESVGELATTAAPEQAKQEQEASAFADNLLILERALRHSMLGHGPEVRVDRICTFARQQGVTPGIVVGRLQRAGHLPDSHCNELKTALDWTSLGTG